MSAHANRPSDVISSIRNPRVFSSVVIDAGVLGGGDNGFTLAQTLGEIVTDDLDRIMRMLIKADEVTRGDRRGSTPLEILGHE